jgi:predicted RNase H-like HicB family nuclease
MQKKYNFPVIIEKDEHGVYIATVPSLRGCHTQAKNLTTLYKRIEEVISLCLEVEKNVLKEKISNSKFIGVQNFEFSI